MKKIGEKYENKLNFGEILGIFQLYQLRNDITSSETDRRIIRK